MDTISLTWVGGEHDFALSLGNLRAIQKHCDAGPVQILNRLSSGEWRVDDVFEVIRQGLIGSGMDNAEASKLVGSMMERHPLINFTVTAEAVLAAALVGVEDDPVGEPEGEAPPPENGDTANSTEQAP